MKKFLLAEKGLIILSSIIIIVYYLPYFLLGENFPLTIHDNLDSNVVWAKILIDNNLLFSIENVKIKQVFNGLNYSNFFGSYYLNLFSLKLFGIYWGIVFNKFIGSILAFIGMVLILKKYIHKNDQLLIIYFFSLSFSLLPFWGIYFNLQLLPLVFYSFLNIRNNTSNLLQWLILIIYPFNSSLVLTGIFIFFILFVIITYDYINLKKINRSFLLAIFIFASCYLLSHLPLIQDILLSKSISQRSEMKFKYYDFFETLKNFREVFIYGHYHALSLHLLFIPFVFIALYLYFKKNYKFPKLFIFIFYYLMVSYFVFSFIDFKYVQPFAIKIFSILPVKLHRCIWLNPLLWHILGALSISFIFADYKRFFKPFLVLIIFQVFLLFSNHEYIDNRNYPSFKNFYSTNQFDEIKKRISIPISDFNILSIGIHPAVAQYNGFYTLDGYFPNYPLKYKLQFREIIENELKKSKELNDYFDNFGSRCYAFSSEIGKEFVLNKGKQIKELNYNFNKLKKLNCKYLISSVKINGNFEDIKLVKKFTNPNYFWEIYLYEIV